MRLRILSDLHFEFHRDAGAEFVRSLDPSGIDVLVLAGDIAVGFGIPEALRLLCSRFRGAAVVYVHGNHEFYGTQRERVLELTEQALKENPNLVFLDVASTEVAGRRILGAPLWFPDGNATARAKAAMTDFEAIPGYESWVYAENARAVAFFERELCEGDIVVTHHLPAWKSVAASYSGSPLNAFFVSDVADLIRERRPRLWVHGHTHSSVRYDIGSTTVLANPYGYAGHSLNDGFSASSTIDV